ncbi:early nodulin-75-like [Anopheles albimanus]|uniref:early nodulin-75-like n=1 Tax=Anopheles albimanus TaxID=7167 RepID=UPI0016421740|nr:early nodulin-75-like [Anopheles albimanus]
MKLYSAVPLAIVLIIAAGATAARRDGYTKVSDKCGEYEVIVPSPPVCEATCEYDCDDESYGHTNVVYKPTCVCLKGYVRLQGKCVPKSHCPPKYESGSYEHGERPYYRKQEPERCPCGKTPIYEDDSYEEEEVLPCGCQKPTYRTYEKPEPKYKKPEPEYKKPEPCYEKPAPYHPTPAPYHPKPAPYHPKPEPCYEKPEPYHPKPEPCYEKPEPYTPKPYKKPEPCYEKPEPYHPKPAPYHPKPEPCYEKPEPYHPKPEPCYEKPEPYQPKPEPCYEKPEPYHPKPEPYTPKPEPCYTKTEPPYVTSPPYETPKKCCACEHLVLTRPCCEPTCDNDCSTVNCPLLLVPEPTCACLPGYVRYNGHCIAQTSCPRSVSRYQLVVPKTAACQHQYVYTV